MTERINALADKFSRDRDIPFREQLQRIQIDMNLSMKVDPYAKRPLEVLETQFEHGLKAEMDSQGGGGRSLLEMAGPTFHQWLHDIEDLVEERDYDLVKQKVWKAPSGWGRAHS